MSISLGSEVRRDRLALWIVAGLLLLVMLFVAWQYIGTVMLGLFVYYVTRPVFDRIYRRLGNRTLSVVVSIFTVALPVLFLTAWAGFVVVQGVINVLGTQGFEEARDVVQPYVDVSELEAQFETIFDQALADPGQLTAIGAGDIDTFLDALFSSFILLFNVFISAFIVLIITFYLLRDDHRLATWARHSVTPEGSILDVYLKAVDRDLKNVYFGNILNALITGLIGAVVYSLLNLVAPAVVQIPEPVLLGLLTGVASLIPVIGMKIIWIPVAILLLVDSLLADPATLWFPVLFAVVSSVIVDYIPDQLLRPYVSGKSLHVGMIMLAYVIGPLLFGWYGLFLGPFILVIVFEFGKIVVPWLAHPDRDLLADLGDPDRTLSEGGYGTQQADTVVTKQEVIFPSGMLASQSNPEPGNTEDPSEG